MTSIAELVCEQLSSLDAFGAPPRSALRATPVLNWGGFGNRSFLVDGGVRRLHVKLTDDADAVRGLRRWWSVRDRLTARCGAPRMLDWMSLPAASLEGVVLEWIDGAVPASRDGMVQRSAGALLVALHDDAELANQLRDSSAPARSCATAYRESLHDRFVEDLRSLHDTRPPFVAPATLRWMTAEAEALLQRVDGGSAFREPADVATHRDPWLNNVIVTPSGNVHLIDWDDMGLGDPMMDWAMLLGPCMNDLRPADPRELPDTAFDDAALERFTLLSRASLLDWVIDSLADWIEAEEVPQRDEVRAVKRRVHEAALATYRERYG